MPIARFALDYAHRRIWKAVPRRWRRRGLVNLTTALAPRARATAPVGPFIVAGYLTAASGLGVSARLCHDALKARGIDVMGVDLTRQFMQGSDKMDFAFTDASAHKGPATVILHVNGPFVPLAMWWLGRAFTRDKFIAGYWAWELPNAPPDWKAGLRFTHRVFAPSTFTANAIRALGSQQPVDVLHHPVALDPPLPSPPQPGRPFTVLVVFNMASSFARKNPMASIRAFNAAFGDDPETRLLVKLQNGDTYADGLAQLKQTTTSHANIDIDERTLSSGEMRTLYADCDVVVSLHRAEGFGLVVAEAMLAARPVIATNWSGNTDFLTPENGMPIPCSLVPAHDPQGEYEHPSMSWAEPDIAAAASALGRIRADPELRERLGRKAAADARRLFCASAYCARLKRLLGRA